MRRANASPFVRRITPETGLLKAEGTVLNCDRQAGTAEAQVTDRMSRFWSTGRRPA